MRDRRPFAQLTLTLDGSRATDGAGAARLAGEERVTPDARVLLQRAIPRWAVNGLLRLRVDEHPAERLPALVLVLCFAQVGVEREGRRVGRVDPEAKNLRNSQQMEPMPRPSMRRL